MSLHIATAIAHPNIAFIKYWGNSDDKLRLPMNGSISMNLDSLYTKTTVSWKNKTNVGIDSLKINGILQEGKSLERVRTFLDLVRTQAGNDWIAEVISETNIPAGTGIASSAAAFSALALAATRSAGLNLDPIALSRLARRGSGSACRSIPSGFTEWKVGDADEASYAISLAPPEHWDLVDIIVIISETPKSIGSSEGHVLASSSPLQLARVGDAPRRLDFCRRAIMKKDFNSLAEIVEADSNLMHAVMMTSSPALLYWLGTTLSVMQAVQKARLVGLRACYTVDAGPNVHVICLEESLNETLALVKGIEGVQNTLIARVGGPTYLLNVE
jgi:diphosphomevalonate decarboxylase